MNAMPIIIVAAAIFIIAYRYYHGFIAAKVAVINNNRPTPSSHLADGQNYVPTSKWVLFGHHFAAIAGAGPLVGPVLASQFGYFPGLVWIILGSVMAGSIHDFIILLASIRHDGKSLAEIARLEIGKVSGTTATFGLLLIMIFPLAGLGLVVVNALAESAWGTFTIATTIPIALLMGIWMYKIRPGKTVEATIAGVILLTLSVIIGKWIPESSFGHYFLFDKHTLTILLAIYGFLASVLPVWLLLSPRDYLSTIMKLAVAFFLGLGVIIVAPDLKMPAFTVFTAGGGPIIPGKLFPYLFITIACGAISGFHAVVGSGTTPKMIMKESHIKPIAAGAMLAEAFISILALIAASSLFPFDYFKINVPTETFGLIQSQLAQMGFTASNLDELSKEVGETLAGRSGGAVSLAVGMAQIFSAIPGMKGLMSYWYHFAIMFEALFILTVIDAGTRVSRFILQEALGKVYKPFANTNWLPGTLISSAIMVFIWAYFIYTGSISVIWPLFGTANQLLATAALVIATSYIINRGKIKYAWTTIIPLAFVGVVTITASFENIFNIFVPMLSKPDKMVLGIIDLVITSSIILMVFILFFDALPKWIKKVKTKDYISDQE